jgi:hypothetical protein
MSRLASLDPFSENTAAPAALEPPVGDVITLKPARKLSQHPEAVRARRRRRGQKATDTAPATRPAGKAAAKPATRSAGRKPASPAADHDTATHVLELGALVVITGAVSAAVYAVLLGSLLPMYPGPTGYLRAFIPLGADALAGSAVAWAVMHRGVSAWLRVPLAALAVGFIVYALHAELVAASAAPGVAQRARVEAAIKAPLRDCPLTLSPAPPDEGRQAKLQREHNEAMARTSQAECQRSAQADHDAAVANARTTASGEADLPRMLSWLAAPCASAFLPLLVAFVRVARRQAKAVQS